MHKSITIIVIVFLAAGFSLAQTNYYLGTGSPSDPVSTSCASCHHSTGSASPIYNDWITTGHSTTQDSTSTLPYYQYSCLECHNTGWDVAVTNYGADEYVMLDTNQTPNFVITDQQNWDRVKNVGCESCHGPLGTDQRTLNSDHWNPAVNIPDYTAENCGECHQDSHHPYIEEWNESKHSEFPSFIPNLGMIVHKEEHAINVITRRIL